MQSAHSFFLLRLNYGFYRTTNSQKNQSVAVMLDTVYNVAIFAAGNKRSVPRSGAQL